MRTLFLVGAALAACSIAPAAMAASSGQPPMNDFNFAFYTCDDGAFQISYDSDTPKTATMTTSDNNKQYVLARKPAANGVEFSNGAARFWTDGKTVVVEGAEAHFQNCKLKAS